MGNMTAEPLYVCINVAEFPAQARLRLHPEHAHLPVAVLEGNPPLEWVCSLNRKAVALGIAHRTTRTELEKFQGITALQRSTQEEDAARTALLSFAGAFTPRAEFCKVASSSAPSLLLVLDMSGTKRIFGTPKQMAESIARAIRKLRMIPRLAVSSNFHVSLCASAFADKTPWIIQAGDEREALGGLPIRALGLTEEQRSTFELWGLRTVGEFAQLPEMDVAVRLGQAGTRLHALAKGELPHLMVPEEATLAFQEQMQFDTPLENLESLLFVLGRMLEQLILRTQAHALAIASLTLRFVLDSKGEHVRALRPALPSGQKEALLKLLHLDLQAHPPGAGVLQIRVHAEPGRRSKVQTGLFSPPLPEPMRLDVLLARLRALVGEERVGRAHLLDTHRPDAFTLGSFTATAKAPQQRPTRATAALRRFRPPISLEVQLDANAPTSFSYGNRPYTVAEAYGPWRRSGDWWSDQVWSQEEWDVLATTPGEPHLLGVLSHDLLHRCWRLDALYD